MKNKLIPKHQKAGKILINEPVSESTYRTQPQLNINERELLNFIQSNPDVEDQMMREYTVKNSTSPTSNQGVIVEAKEDNIKNNFFRSYNNFRYTHPWAKGLNWAPVVGDVMDGISLLGDVNNGDYLSAGLGLGMLALPNFIQKPGQKAIKKSLISKSIITDPKTGVLLYTPDEIVNSGDFVKGKEVAVRFFEHPVVQQSYKHNQKLAKRLGITIPDKNPSQIVSQPVKYKYEDLGNNTVANVSQSYYGDPNAVISMNQKQFPLYTIRQGLIHENLHRGYYSAPLRPAILDKEYYNTIYKPEYIFLDWKTKKLLKPEYHNSYLADIAGGEAGPNFIDLGRGLGLKLGQKYPGYDKVIDMLNKYNGDKGFMIKQLNDSKAGMRHVWDAMTGKYFILPLIGGTTYYKLNNLNNEK